MDMDFRRPVTLEELIDACTVKMRNDAVEAPETVVEIVLGPEVMLELALRVLALETRQKPLDRWLTAIEEMPE
jgi:hypothetical protein